jgi:uncharacterized protein (TIGR03118 family)
MQLRSLKVLALAAIVAASVLAAAAPLGAAEQNAYKVTNLVSNTAAIPAVIHDESLRNAWGLTASSTSPWWVADNAADVSTLYNGNTPPAKVALTVSVPTAPTGTVFNIASVSGAFPVTGGTSRFLFATEHGQILGWPGTGAAQVSAAQSFAPDAIYKGLAIASTPAGPRLYATDFHNGRVDVWDGSWNLVNPSSSFVDPSIPAGYAPFGIQRIGDSIFVTYAKQDADRHDDVPVPGQAYVDEFTPDGQLVARVVNSGKKNAPLNAPWGLALAPASFNVFGGDLLVGNFGNGRISAYTKRGNTWVYKGQLRLANGTPIAIDGLWAIAFGNGSAAGPTDTLYFLAGPSGEKHGLFGSITTG